MPKKSSVKTANLTLLFLGQPRVALSGSAIAFPRRKILALLAYLAVTTRPCTRDELAELLFPERSSERARADLRQTLCYLRDSIGEEWIESGPQMVAIRRKKGLLIDVVECRKLLSRPGHGTNRIDLAKAVKLYRGEFLSGFYLKDCPAYEQWQGALGESLRQDYAGALQSLIDLDIQNGELAGATGWARTAVDLDPLDERAQRILMRVLASAGRRTQALRQYERLRSLLTAELGEEPDEETKELREEICAGRVAIQHERTTLAPSESPPAARSVLLAARVRVGGKGAGSSSRIAHALQEAGGTLEASAPTAEVRSVFGSAARALAAAVVMAADAVALTSTDRDRDWERASSMLRAAHPGQVLLSEAVVALAAGALPRGTVLHSLGVRTLDDLGPPVCIHQLAREKPASPFLTPKTLDTLPGNLSSQPTSIVGRKSELAAISSLLQGEEIRILTLTGPGGAGKTRLALHAAARLTSAFSHGAWFVDLAAISDPTLVVPAIAVSVRFRQSPGDERPLIESLKDFLKRRQMLLILDNFEHLLAAAAVAVELSAACPGVKMLVTSREPLHLRGENQFPVSALSCAPLAADAQQLAASEAVQLFAIRARAADPSFVLCDGNVTTVAQICIELDCVPLAIELAAAQVNALPPRALLQQLPRRLELIAGGANDLPPRQRGLGTEIAWSYDLLSQEEQRVFRALGVFTGGCSLEAVQCVCAGPGVVRAVAALADKNLLTRDASSESRFRMLETIREFAREKLRDRGEAASVEERFSEWAGAFAEEAAGGLYGPDQALSLGRLDADNNNLQHALSCLLERREAERGSRLAAALGWYWFRKGQFTVGERWLRSFDGICDASVSVGVRGRIKEYLGWMWLMFGDMLLRSAEALSFFRQSSKFARQDGDTRTESISIAWLSWLEAELPDAMRNALADRSVKLARSSGDPWAYCFCLKIANSYSPRTDLDLPRKTAGLEEAIRIAHEVGDPFLVCQVLHGMGDMYMFVGDHRTAERWFLRALRLATEIGDAWSAFDTRFHLGYGYLELSDVPKARGCFTEALREAVASGARSYFGEFFRGLAYVAQREGDRTRAILLAGASSKACGRWDSVQTCPGVPRETFERMWAQGEAMSFDEAVQFALEGDRRE